MQFEDLQLIDPLLRAIRAEGYVEPTPIQQRAIPHVLAAKDLLGCAQTGTGKTAAFALPILQRLATPGSGAARSGGARPRPIRALVLSPTRELASQIAESFRVYGAQLGLHQTVVFGGVGQNPQVTALRRGVDILVATPGRLLDLMGQGVVRFDQLEVLVLDEADRMLDMGFIHDVRKIVAKLPTRRQTLLFSATLPHDIRDLAGSILKDPVRIEVTPAATPLAAITQSIYFVETPQKRALLGHVLRDPAVTRALVFTRTKHGADRVTRVLVRSSLQAEAIHGNKSQNARERALAKFKTGATRILVATDIAARGIDVDGISHVVNFDLPNIPETYVHRIGRTARAGGSGAAISFCDAQEREYLRDIQRAIRMQIPVIHEHPYAAGSGKPPGTERSERPERSERAERSARPERPAQRPRAARPRLHAEPSASPPVRSKETPRNAADVISAGLRSAAGRRGRWNRRGPGSR